jgi:hypothetical protein
VNYSELPSSRGYPEGSVRLEVRVPSWESLSKSEDSDTQASEVRRGAEYFSREDFRRNCEVVKLVVVLQQYSTFTQQRVIQPFEIRDRPRHCLNHSSCSTRCTRTGVSAAIATRPKCLSNSVRSTGPTETVLGNSKRPKVLITNRSFRSRCTCTFDVQVQAAVSFKPESSRQQCPQY